MSMLDELIQYAGRQSGDVRRTLTITGTCWRTEEELEDRLHGVRRWPPLRNLSSKEILDALRSWPALIGTPEEIIARTQTYEEVGITEIALQWLAVDDIEGPEMLAAEVLPYVA